MATATHTQHLQERAAAQLRDYLVTRGMRQTPERYAVLAAAYAFTTTFTAEELIARLKEEHAYVSQPTVYNSLQLFLQANLVVRYPHVTHQSVYLRVESDAPRCYQVCNYCGRTTPIKNRALTAAVAAYHTRSFNISHRVLYICGVCGKCKRMKNEE